MKTRTVQLREVGEWGSGGTPLVSRREYYGGDVPWLIIEDLNDGVVRRANKTISRMGLENSAAKVVPQGTLLIAMYGSIGKLGITGMPCATNQAMAFCKCNTAVVDPEFLFFWLLHERERFIHAGRGGTQQNISQEFLKDYPIPLPSLPEQRRIAGMLEQADRLRRTRRYALELSATFLPATFLEMFGDPVRNPRGWLVELLADVCDPKSGIKAGPFGSSLKKDTYSKSGVRIYGQEQVIAGDFSMGDYYLGLDQFEDFRAYEVKPGDLLFSLVGTFGKVVVVPDGIERGIINPRLLKISPVPERMNSIFLATLLQHPSEQSALALKSHGGTMGILNAGLLKELAIIVPPLPLQQRFADLVRGHERLRAAQRESLRQAEHLFQSLLHRAFGLSRPRHVNRLVRPLPTGDSEPDAGSPTSSGGARTVRGTGRMSAWRSHSMKTG